MPKTGDYYIAILKKTHVRWGTYRHTNSRAKIRNEGYLPIPSKFALSYNITNLHNIKQQSNIYKFSTSDRFLEDQELKASGNRKRGDKFAKNLHGNGDLKLLGTWYKAINAIIRDKIKVEFLSPTEILLTKL